MVVSLVSVSHAIASTEAFDEQMQPVLEAYLEIPSALAADRVTGVTEAARKIEKLSRKLDPSLVTGEHREHYRDLPSKLESAASRMARAKDIETMRKALVELSKPMAMWATMSEPEGISVVYCSMTPGSWLQRGTTISNPYYGSKMLRCGEIVAGEGHERKAFHGDKAH